MSKQATYTARWSDGRIVYASQPHGNLFGLLPLGFMPAVFPGSVTDEWDGAVFGEGGEGGEKITVTRDVPLPVVVAGHHRKRALESLGLPVPVVLYGHKEDTQKRTGDTSAADLLFSLWISEAPGPRYFLHPYFSWLYGQAVGQ